MCGYHLRRPKRRGRSHTGQLRQHLEHFVRLRLQHIVHVGRRVHRLESVDVALLGLNSCRGDVDDGVSWVVPTAIASGCTRIVNARHQLQSNDVRSQAGGVWAD